MNKIWWVIALAVGALITGCATKVTRTNQLYPGMQPEQVKEVMGEPSQTQFISNKWIWKYSLHEPWKGFIPYYLAFSKEKSDPRRMVRKRARIPPAATTVDAGNATNATS